MVAIQRVRVPWSGGVGGAGLSTFYFFDAAASLSAVRSLFDTIKQYVPSGISWTFDGAGDEIESLTGQITGAWSGTGQALVQASGITSYAAPAGGMIQWNTDQVFDGHRVRGRTYIVPCSGSGLQVDGTLAPGFVTAMSTGASLVVNAVANNQVVWTRPRPATPEWTDVHGRVHPAVSARAGTATTVVNANGVDKAVVLRSRRD